MKKGEELEMRGGGGQGRFEQERPRDALPGLISSSAVWHRGHYQGGRAGGQSTCPRRRRSRRSGEERAWEGGTVRTSPGALRFGQRGVLAPHRYRLLRSTVRISVCGDGRVRLPWEAARSPGKGRQAPRQAAPR